MAILALRLLICQRKKRLRLFKRLRVFKLLNFGVSPPLQNRDLFFGPMVKTGQFNEKLNHYNLLRTLEDLYGLAHAGESKTVESIMSIWK